VGRRPLHLALRRRRAERRPQRPQRRRVNSRCGNASHPSTDRTSVERYPHGRGQPYL